MGKGLGGEVNGGYTLGASFGHNLPVGTVKLSEKRGGEPVGISADQRPCGGGGVSVVCWKDVGIRVGYAVRERSVRIGAGCRGGKIKAGQVFRDTRIKREFTIPVKVKGKASADPECKQ